MSDLYDSDTSDEEHSSQAWQAPTFSQQVPLDLSNLTEFRRYLMVKTATNAPSHQEYTEYPTYSGQTGLNQGAFGSTSNFDWSGTSLLAPQGLPDGGGLLSPYVRQLSSSSQPLGSGPPATGPDGMTAEQEQDYEAMRKKHDYPGQFAQGVFSPPKEGPDRYEGMTGAEKVGRLVGENVPLLDSGRELAPKLRDAYQKIQRGESLTDAEIGELESLGAKAGLESLPWIGLIGKGYKLGKAAASASNILK